jgi:hypothetical protein
MVAAHNAVESPFELDVSVFGGALFLQQAEMGRRMLEINLALGTKRISAFRQRNLKPLHFDQLGLRLRF